MKRVDSCAAFLRMFALTTLLVVNFNFAKAAEDGDTENKQNCGESLENVKTATTKKATAKRPAAKKSTATAAKKTDTSAEPISRKVWKLEEFLVKDPEKNLAAQHPSTVVTAAQFYWSIVKKTPPRKIKDPLYRVKDIYTYPLFNGELEESKDHMIIGQEEAIQSMLTYVHSKARGDKSSKAVLLIGPGGTGKTEAVSVLNWNRNLASNKIPEYHEYTYNFVNLKEIDELKWLGDEITADMKRSPFTLLRNDMQNEAMDIAYSELKDFAGYDVTPWRTPDPKAKAIIQAILKHHIPQFKSGEWQIDDIPRDEYLKHISRHVNVIRRERDIYEEDATNIIGAVEDNPNMELLFVSQDPPLILRYPNDSPLRFNYRGQYLQQDGGALVLDEAYRNDSPIFTIALEMLQNDTIRTDAGAVVMDTLHIWTANDESVEGAKEENSLKALLDRMHSVPVRHLLHPHQIAKAFLYTYGTNRFQMRNLVEVDSEGKESSTRTTTGKIVPLELNKAYPNPDANGNVVGINGRQSLYYKAGEKNLLVSPHTLEMMTLAAAATRLVTDPSQLTQFMSELQVVNPSSHLYTSAASRLKVILGEHEPEAKIRADLYKLRDLLKEGEKGISHRNLESWFREAIELTEQKGRSSITPMILDEAFKNLISKGTIAPPTKQLRATWLNQYRSITGEFILPALYSDIRKIVSGDGEKAERIYDQIVGEIVTLASNGGATEWVPGDGSSPQPIQEKRLEEIKKRFRDVNGFEFSDAFLLQHLSGASTGNTVTRNRELLDAIEAWLVESESETTELAGQISEYYEGKNKDPKVERLVNNAEQRMAAYGYDQQSFKEAIAFWKKLVYERDRNRQQQRQ